MNDGLDARYWSHAALRWYLLLWKVERLRSPPSLARLCWDRLPLDVTEDCAARYLIPRPAPRQSARAHRFRTPTALVLALIMYPLVLPVLALTLGADLFFFLLHTAFSPFVLRFRGWFGCLVNSLTTWRESQRR